MKFGIITDIHLGPDEYWNNKKRTIHKTFRKDLRSFLKEINSNEQVSFIINLGDFIVGEDSKKDAKRLKSYKKFLSKTNKRFYNVVGNHDTKYLSLDEILKFLNQKNSYYSFDKENYHFVVLYTPHKGNKSGSIFKEQLDWLKQDLSKTNKKTIIFSHYSLADQDLKRNLWFEGAPEFCLVKNRKEVRKILEKSKKVVAVINGHLHWNNKTIHNKIPYFTVQSLVENEDDKGRASGAYALVNLEYPKILIDIKGKYPKKMKYTNP